MDVLIRAGLIGALAVLCYQVFSPFLTLMVWSIILAVTLYPLHQWLARRIGGKQGLASTILVIVGMLLIIIPTALLMNSFADSVRSFIDAVQHNTLAIPAPREGVDEWPIVGKKIYDIWSKAHADLPGLVQSMQPKIGELARKALGHRRQHWRRPVAVSGLIHRRQHHDGIRRIRCARQSSDFRSRSRRAEARRSPNSPRRPSVPSR